jgi:hypothetical protein
MGTRLGAYRQLTLWSEALPASPSASPDCGKGSMIPGADSCSAFLKSLEVTGLDGLSGKMSPVSCRATEDGILAPSSGGWRSSGTGGPIGSWTLSFSESPREGVECLLSHVLETSDVPDRFYLSPKACAGILRRAARRGKTLPAMLATALKAQALHALSTAQTPEP